MQYVHEYVLIEYLFLSMELYCTGSQPVRGVVSTGRITLPVDLEGRR